MDGIGNIGRTPFRKFLPVIAVLPFILFINFQDAHAVIFQDSYSSAGWTQVGNETYISNGHVVIDGIDGSDHHIYKPLGITLNNTDAFRLDFDFNFIAANNPADYLVALTDGTANPSAVNNYISAAFGITGNQLAVSYKSTHTIATLSSSNIPLTANTKYYVTLERLNSTLVKVSAFSDPARTIHVAGSPIYQTIPSQLGGMSIIEHGVDSNGCTCRSMTGYVDNTVLTKTQEGILIFSDNYASAGWTQVGNETYISNGHVVIDGIDGSDHHIYKPLGITLNNTDAFRLDFDFNFIAANNPADYLVALTDGTANPGSANNVLGGGFGLSGNNLVIAYTHAPDIPRFSNSAIPLTANTKYYVTLERLNSTLVKVSAFSDPARTIHVAGSPIYQTIPSQLGGMSIIEHGVVEQGCLCRSMTGYVDNTLVTSSQLIMNDTTSTFGFSVQSGRPIHAEYVSPSSVLIGQNIDTISMTLKKVGSPIGTATVGIFRDTGVAFMKDTTSTFGLTAFNGRQVQSELITPSSVLVGSQIDTMQIQVRKVGNPTGNVIVGVFDSSLGLKKQFGTINLSTLANTYHTKSFSLPANQLYTISADDRIGIQFTGGNTTNAISIMTDHTNSFDGANSVLASYTSSWTNDTASDLTMTLSATPPALIKQFGVIDVSTLPTSYKEQSFSLILPNTYQIKSGDYIGIKYTGGTNATNNIAIMTDQNSADPFDGTNTYYKYFTNAWHSFPTNDVTMKLIHHS